MKKIKNISTNGPDDIKKSAANAYLLKLHKQLFSLRNLLYAEKSHALFPVVHDLPGKDEIQERHNVINGFEEHLRKNDTIILKFYLHISQKEQQRRLERRLTSPEKKWKYNAEDKKEAKKWDDYMDAYQNVFAIK